MQASALVSDAEKASLGITVAQTAGPIGPPTTAPLVSIECGARLQQTPRFVDATTPTRPPTKAKPPGALGVEIWNKVGLTPPTGSPSVASRADPIGDPRTFSFLTMTTRPSFRAEFKAGDGGKTAVYMTRWVNTRGEKGHGRRSQR